MVRLGIGSVDVSLCYVLNRKDLSLGVVTDRGGQSLCLGREGSRQAWFVAAARVGSESRFG